MNVGASCRIRIPGITSVCAHLGLVARLAPKKCTCNGCVCLTAGPGTAADGSGERRAAHHIVGAAHHGPGNVWGSGPNHNAGPCVWSTRTTAGKQRH